MSLRKNTLLNLLGVGIPTVITLLTVPHYLRLIGAERYGALTVLWSLMGYFGFMDLGMGRAVGQFLAGSAGKSALQRSGIVWTALISTTLIGVLAGVMFWISSDFILTHWISMSPDRLKEALAAVPWFILGIPLLLGGAVLIGALQGRQMFLAKNVLTILTASLGQIIPLAVAASGRVGIDSLVPAMLFARIVTIVMNFWYCRHRLPLGRTVRFQLSYLKPLLKYGGWVSLISILEDLLESIDRLAIGAFAGAKAVALYTVPYNTVAKVRTLSYSFHSAILPKMASESQQNASDLALNASYALASLMGIIAIPAIGIIHPFLVLWVGSDFAHQAQGVGEIVMLGVFLNSMVIAEQAFLMSHGKVRRLTMIYILEVPVYLVLLWFCLQRFGIIGAALAWTARMLVDVVMLLGATKSFAAILRHCALVLFAVVAATALSYYMPENDIYRWLGLLLCFMLALFSGREHLERMIPERVKLMVKRIF